MRVLSLALLLVPALVHADPPRKPNIVFILTDDLGINDLSCYGRKDHATPHLDKLAKQGMRFTCAYVGLPICSASRAAIMSGKAPARVHLTTYLPGRPDAPSQKLLHPKIQMQLTKNHKTIAEYLSQAGYATGCVGKWHLGGKNFGPKERGFGFYHPGKANTKPSATEGGKGEYDLTRAAEGFIETNKSKPFFLYLCHNTPHIPLGAKQELIKKFSKSFNPTYAAMMATMDDCVGRIVKKLDDLKLSDNTLVVFTSDHGGLHVLEGTITPATHNTPFRAGKGFLYEGGLRVPTIVRWPGKVGAGKVSDTPIINMDWLPTFVEVAGAKPTGTLDGISLVPLLKGKTLKERPFYWHFPHYTNQGSRPHGAMRDGNWKLIENYEDGSLELYDLAKDASEKTNLASKDPKKAAALKARLAAWRKEVKVQENTRNPNFNAALNKKLYIDVDVTRLRAEKTAAEMERKLKPWRQLMNAVLKNPKKPVPQSKENPGKE